MSHTGAALLDMRLSVARLWPQEEEQEQEAAGGGSEQRESETAASVIGCPASTFLAG